MISTDPGIIQIQIQMIVVVAVAAVAVVVVVTVIVGMVVAVGVVEVVIVLFTVQIKEDSVYMKMEVDLLYLRALKEMRYVRSSCMDSVD